MRTVNQDRGIREAARVVGSKFAEASGRAIRDGKASVTLVRNANMVDVDGVVYGASSMFISRAVPNFIGDTGATGTMLRLPTTMPPRLRIPEPLEYDISTPQENVIRVGDSVRVSESSPVSSTVAYEITGIESQASSPPMLILSLDRKSTQPALPSHNTAVSYVVERQPKILRSSITDLPPGYIVDLRLSGPVITMETALGETSVIANPPAPRIGSPVRPAFYEVMRPALEGDQTSTAERASLAEQYSRVEIFFDSTGGVSSVRTYLGNWDVGGSLGVATPQIITAPLEFFITPTELEENSSPIYEESNLWVTISNTSGGVNIGYNNPPIGVASGALADLVNEARSTAATGRSASQ